MDPEVRSKLLGGLLGLCVGDALGLPVQFEPRDARKADPVSGMRGWGAFHQPPGTWSDDSSLTFCLAESLCQGFDLWDVASRFVRWLDEGYWTPFGTAFDIGGATFAALSRLKAGASPTEAGRNDEFSNGNGSLMRILPLVYALENKERAEQFEKAQQVSCLTHGHPRSQIACAIYVQFGVQLLKGLTPGQAYARTQESVLDYYTRPPYVQELSYFHRILEGDIARLPEDAIASSGYVVDTLEAALWCLLRQPSYADVVLTAVNLGEDTDTVAAVAGGLAGIYFGYEAIPREWLRTIARLDDILDLGNRLAAALYGE